MPLIAEDDELATDSSLSNEAQDAPIGQEELASVRAHFKRASSRL